MRRLVLVSVLVALALGVCACGPYPPSHGMLDDWVGTTSKATVKAELGLPSMSLPLADGTTEWKYYFGYDAILEDGVGSPNEVCWHYRFIFDSGDVLRSWSRERCQSPADPLKRIREQTD